MQTQILQVELRTGSSVAQLNDPSLGHWMMAMRKALLAVYQGSIQMMHRDASWFESSKYNNQRNICCMNVQRIPNRLLSADVSLRCLRACPE